MLERCASLRRLSSHGCPFEKNGDNEPAATGTVKNRRQRSKKTKKHTKGNSSDSDAFFEANMLPNGKDEERVDEESDARGEDSEDAFTEASTCGYSSDAAELEGVDVVVTRKRMIRLDTHVFRVLSQGWYPRHVLRSVTKCLM